MHRQVLSSLLIPVSSTYSLAADFQNCQTNEALPDAPVTIEALDVFNHSELCCHLTQAVTQRVETVHFTGQKQALTTTTETLLKEKKAKLVIYFVYLYNHINTFLWFS